VQLFVGSMAIGGECAPTPAGGTGAETEKSIISLNLISARVLGSGVLLRYEVVK